MIDLRDITVSFAAFGDDLPVTVLNGLNLSIKDGEFLSLVGTNGAGKSTLLNVLGGTVKLTRGNLVVDGKDVSRMPDYQRASWLARVFADPRLGTCDHLTIEENMAVALSKGQRRGLGPAVTAQERELLRSRLAELRLGLESRMNTPMHLLSSGQRQSITVLMATLTTPKLLLLDEHVANLDPRTQAKVLDLSARAIRGLGLSAIMVTHDVRHAIEYGDRVIALNGGRIILDESGAAKAALTPSDIDAVYRDTSIAA